jgi:predicted nuclease of predicted toxin-antitoxin system
MKFLLDMNLSPDWVEFLAGKGWTAVHCSSVGLADAPDEDLLSWADEHGFVLITQDLDFGLLPVGAGANRPSVIQIRAQGTMPSDIGQAVLNAIAAAHQHLESGAMVTIEPGRMRVRVLPLG